MVALEEQCITELPNPLDLRTATFKKITPECHDRVITQPIGEDTL